MWSPHGHPEAVDALLPLAQVVLLDSVDEPDVGDGAGPRRASWPSDAYVVDLAWLRSTPWRERVAATFDPPPLPRRAAARSPRSPSATTPDSLAAALLFAGWLASRLGWQPRLAAPRDGERCTGTRARAPAGGRRCALEPIRRRTVPGSPA